MNTIYNIDVANVFSGIFDYHCNVIYRNLFFNSTNMSLWTETDKSGILLKLIELCTKFHMTSICNLSYRKKHDNSGLRSAVMSR